MKICLAILYNSPNAPDIDEFEKIYSKNFDKLFHIVPLYRGNKENAINVYENNYQLSGFIAQAYRKILTEDIDYYVFMTQDGALSPEINSQNFAEKFNINDDKTSFCNSVIKPVDNEALELYPWALSSLYYWRGSYNGAETRRFLPKKAQTREIYKKFGISAPYIYYDFLKFLTKHLIIGKQQNDLFNFEINHGMLNVKTVTQAFIPPETRSNTVYPFVYSLSNIFIVPKKILKNFANHCGMFAAVRLHYNIAFATALCLTSEKIAAPNE